MTSSARILRLSTEEATAALTAANHATFRETVTISDAYAVVGNVDDLIRRLPQLLGFLSRAIQRAPGPHYDDRGLDPAEAIHRAAQAVDLAIGGLDITSIQLGSAHNNLGHVGLVTPED